jgi:hypothetical protein
VNYKYPRCREFDSKDMSDQTCIGCPDFDTCQMRTNPTRINATMVYEDRAYMREEMMKGVSYPCMDCGKQVNDPDEYFIIKDMAQVLPIEIEKKQDEYKTIDLCVECLEKRLGRSLNISDFRCIDRMNWAVMDRLFERKKETIH